jgi:hypothetical protein
MRLEDVGIEPLRDAVALALAQIDGDEERIGAVLAGYSTDERTAELVLGLLGLVGLDRDTTRFARLLRGLADAGASRPS